MTIEEKHVCVPPIRRFLRYRLCALKHSQDPPSYCIEIRFENDCFCSLLKTKDLNEARRMYTLMLKGRVTPCTAKDVLEDMLA